MNDRPVQFTMREVRRAAASPLLWAALAGTSLVLGLVGPFGTFDGLSLPSRLAYWAVIVTTTYFASFASVNFLEALLFRRRPGPLGFAMLGALGGPAIAFLVWLINGIVLGWDAIGYVPLLVYVSIIAAVASGLIAFFSTHMAPGQVRAPPRPRLFERLPPALRGRKLLYLSMQDHYVEVVTDAGSHLLLMRLSDAIGEADGLDGLQIHRSHWVAREAVAGQVRHKDRLFLRMSNGAELPVSRNRLRDVRQAGLA